MAATSTLASASDDAMKTFWRATYLGNRRFALNGPPVSKRAFGEAGVLRLWEYGVGDNVRQSTSASLQRIAPGSFELTTDVAVTVSLPARKISVSTKDGPSTTKEVDQSGQWLTVNLAPSDAPYRLEAIR